MNILAIAGGIYLAGVLIAGTVLYRKNAVEKTKADLPAYSFVMLLWPLAGLMLAGAAIHNAIGRYRIRKGTDRIERLRRQSLQSVVLAHPELDDDERLAVASLMTDLALAHEDSDETGGDAYFHSRFNRSPLDEIKSWLNDSWEPPPEVEFRESEIDAKPRILFSCSGIAPHVEKDEWGFHMTHAFRKSIKDLDKNLRGRVLDAITEICIRPMELRGDTVKPLTGELQGFWRYRLGDYRLIYHPDPNAHRIDLISIGGRGQVYAY